MIEPKLPNAVPLLLTPNRRPVKWTRRIELIILHATGKGGFRSAVDWLRKGKRRNRTSAHIIIDRDGTAIQLAPYNDITWHAGRATWGGLRAINTRSIGIELVNKNDGIEEYPIAQLESCMWVCASIAREHNRRPEHVIGHYHVAPGRKTDPLGFLFEEFRESLGYCSQAC